MTLKQQEWCDKRCAALDFLMEAVFPTMTDMEFEAINNLISAMTETAKGKTDDCRNEVRSQLLDVVAKYDSISRYSKKEGNI